MNWQRTMDFGPAALITALALTSCASAEYRQLETLGQGYDEEIGAYKVRVVFEVWDDGLPVQGLTADDLLIYEDGVRATSESIQMLEYQELRRPVTLLLDTSYSMYRADAVGPLVAAAGDFSRQLEDAGFEVDVYRFDAEVREASALTEIPTSWDEGAAGSRWTALYHALESAVSENPDNIFVVFSDGADNFSQNHGVESFEAVQPSLAGAEIHTIGFGNARHERDRQGNRATKILGRVAANATYHYAGDDEGLRRAFDGVFRYIERRSRNRYYVEYYSPNRDGAHELVIRYGRAETEPIRFRAAGA